MSELIPDYEDVNPFRERIAALTAEVARLREALEWYGNEENYYMGDSDVNANAAPLIFDDYGDKARAALSGETK